MRFNILCDIDWESKVDQPLAALSKLGYFEFFEDRNYGDGLLGVTVIFMCQDPGLKLKRRMRLSKKEKKLYMDIMLDLPTMKAAEPMQRQKIIADRLAVEVPEVLAKYKIDNFDKLRFIYDLNNWIASIGWR